MRLKVVQEEAYCLRTQTHERVCKGKNHVCYRCGMLLGRCDCPSLGTQLDY